MKIIWTEKAVEKLEEYADYIALDKPIAAVKWAEKIQNSVNKLDEFPNIGREVPELKRPDIRELIEGEYRIIYRLESNRIYILTVYHSKQLLKKSVLFKKRKRT